MFKKFTPYALLISLAFSNALAEPSNVVRLEYIGLGTPDHLIYEMLVDGIAIEAKQKSREEMVERVRSELNVVFDDQRQAWIFERNASKRHSIEEAQKLLVLMLSDSHLLEILNEESKFKLLCATNQSSMSTQEVFTAFSHHDDASHEIAEQRLSDTNKKLNPKVASSLRRWIGRAKPGFKGRWYNYDVLWEGKESEFEQIHQGICNQSKGSDL